MIFNNDERMIESDKKFKRLLYVNDDTDIEAKLINIKNIFKNNNEVQYILQPKGYNLIFILTSYPELLDIMIYYNDSILYSRDINKEDISIMPMNYISYYILIDNDNNITVYDKIHSEIEDISIINSKFIYINNPYIDQLFIPDYVSKSDILYFIIKSMKFNNNPKNRLNFSLLNNNDLYMIYNQDKIQENVAFKFKTNYPDSIFFFDNTKYIINKNIKNIIYIDTTNLCIDIKYTDYKWI